jgi:hypothetical protein
LVKLNKRKALVELSLDGVHFVEVNDAGASHIRAMVLLPVRPEFLYLKIGESPSRIHLSSAYVSLKLIFTMLFPSTCVRSLRWLVLALTDVMTEDETE